MRQDNPLILYGWMRFWIPAVLVVFFGSLLLLFAGQPDYWLWKEIFFTTTMGGTLLLWIQELGRKPDTTRARAWLLGWSVVWLVLTVCLFVSHLDEELAAARTGVWAVATVLLAVKLKRRGGEEDRDAADGSAGPGSG